jgi:hypothetical protein
MKRVPAIKIRFTAGGYLYKRDPSKFAAEINLIAMLRGVILVEILLNIHQS